MTSRRTFLKASASIALIPLVSLETTSSFAAATAKVPLNDPAASALKYVEDATKASRTDKQGVAAAAQFCDNCQFYTASASEAGYGGCTLFQNRLVTQKGWCLGWIKKS